MRRTEEIRTWRKFQEARKAVPAAPFQIAEAAEIDVNRPCTVLGGRNGSGKSRLLRAIAEAYEDGAVYLDLHHLCEQSLMVLRSLGDLDDMKQELGRIGPDERRAEDATRIVGRDYDSVDWFALDIGPADEAVAAKFRWAGSPEDSPITPYFTATYADREYGALEMGLGEFSVHLLLWILEQFKDRRNLLLLLDEPDAYLPPVGVERLLHRLLAICLQRGWRMVISTHSEEMIASAVDHDSFLLLRLDTDGTTQATHSEHDASIADTLLARPHIERVLFVEDESAMYLCRALLDRGDRALSRVTSIFWGDGVGDLVALRRHLPKPSESELKFAVVPDGDQRVSLSDADLANRWPLHFLPSYSDPDYLYRGLKSDPGALAQALQVNTGELQRKLDDLEGEDSHDWVNRLAETYGRAHVLTSLAARWTVLHPDAVSEFVSLVRRRSL